MKTKIPEEDTSLRCGFGGFAPKFLQFFNSTKWFLFFLCMFSMVQGMAVNGLTNASVPHLEREFGFSSKEASIIVASNDVSGLLLVLFVSYFGDKGKKPRWIGCGAIITGLGCLMFALPKLLKGVYRPGHLAFKFESYDTCDRNRSEVELSPLNPSCSLQQPSSLYIAIFSLSQLIMGAGVTPLFTLGASYVDENVMPKESPIYIGIWYLSTFFGPGLGFVFGGLMLNQYVDKELPNDILSLDPHHPRWVGRWWSGYVIASPIFILVGICLLAFPRRIPGAHEARRLAILNGDLQDKDVEQEMVHGFKGFIRATIKIIVNKTVLFACLALSAKTITGGGMASFFAKLLIVRYGASPKKANFLIAFVLVIGTGFGLIAGSVWMRKIKLKGSVKKAALICTVAQLLGISLGLAQLIPGCKTANLVGLNVPYVNSNFSLLSSVPCSIGCGCIKDFYNPVCNREAKLTYLSPCHAGCTNKTNGTIYSDCMCADGIASTSLTAGTCERDCENIILFTAVILFAVIAAFFGGTPHNMLVIRSVPDNQRSFALGFQFLLVRSLGLLPGPVLVGSLIDSSCIVWKLDECGIKQNCDEYDLTVLARNLMSLGCVCSGLSFILYLITWKTCKIPKERTDYKEFHEVNGNLNAAFASDSQTKF